MLKYQEKDRVRWRRVNIRHDSSDSVMSPCMGTTFSASILSVTFQQPVLQSDLPCSHVSVVGAAVAGINDGVAGVDCLGVIVVTRQAVRCVATSWSVYKGQVGELLTCD